MATITKPFRAKTGLTVELATTTLATGTTSYPPLTFQSGTNTSAVSAGTMEYDGTRFYLNPSTTRRGVALTDSGGTILDSAIVSTSITKIGTLSAGSTGGFVRIDGSGNLTSDSSTYLTSGTAVTSISFGTTGLTPSTGTTGAVTVAGTLVVANGGTGATTLASNGVLLGNGTSAITATTGTADQVLRIPGAGGAPAFGAIDLTKSAAVTGALGATNGGTGQSSYTTGDILYASSGTALSKLGVGTAAQVLVGGTTPAWGSVNLSGANKSVTGTLAIGDGGTGSTTGSITGSGALTFTAGGTNTNVNLVPNGTGTVDVASKRITNVATPTASIANVSVTYTATGGTSTRGQITAAPNTLDGVTLAANDRILLKDQTAGAQNGIYVVSTLGTGSNGVWDRATDFDSDAEVTAGAYVWVEEGSTNQDSAWVLTTDNPITIGGSSGTALTWVLFSSAGNFIAGAGLTKSGNTIDIGTASSARIVVNADNIDLATVSQTNTTGTTGLGFVQSHTIDTYGRTTGTVSASLTNTQFTASSGTVSINNLAGSVITSGTVSPTYGGTGVNNGSSTITIAGNLTTTVGAVSFAAQSGGSSVTLPTSGTLATLAGAESLTNKKLGSLTTNGLVTTSGGDGTLSVTTMGTGIATFLSTPSSANLAAAVTDETGTGALVFAGSPALTGTPTLNAQAAFATGSVNGSTTTKFSSGTIFNISAYRAAEFTVKVVDGTDYELLRALVVVKGAAGSANLYYTAYGDVQSGSGQLAAITYDVDASGNVTLGMTPTAAVSTTATYMVTLM